MPSTNHKLAFIIPPQLRSYQYSVIKNYLVKPGIEICSIFSLNPPPIEKANALIRLHLNIDNKLCRFPTNSDDTIPQEVLQTTIEKSNINQISINTIKELHTPLKTLNQAEHLHIIDFTNCVNISEIPKSQPNAVVWQIQFGRSNPKNIQLVGYNEIVNNDTEIQISILKSTNEYTRRTYDSGYYKLFPASFKKTRNYLLSRGAHFLSKTLEKPNDIASAATSPNERSSTWALPGYGYKMLQLAWKKKFLKSHWTLAFRKTDMLPESMESFCEIEQPKDRFWADPFLIQENDQTHVFFEELEYSKGKGDIAHFTIDKNGIPGPCTKLIEKNYHLSYPFVFKNEGVYYMIPETSENRTVDLYKSTEFPTKWEFEKTLMRDTVAADTTLFEHASKWWMFTTLDRDNCGTNDDELYLFYADRHDSDNWTAHPMNPIVRDIRSARLAGKVFRDRRNRIIRPSQDCSAYYGRGLNINEIEILSTTEYKERRLNRIDATDQPTADGVHTFNNLSGISIIDQFCWTK